MGRLGGLAERHRDVLAEPQGLEVEGHGTAVEDSQDGGLAEDGR